MAVPRRLSALAFALAFALPAFAGTPATEQALEQCVVIPQPAKAALRDQANAVVGWTDAGNVTVMQVAGDYGRNQTAPRQDVAKTFFAAHPDDYDFLVTFTTFEFDTGDATAFYNAIRNDVQGIGDTTYDYSEAFGSTGKLQGYIDMAATSRYGLRPHDPGYEGALNVLAHELMHRWGSRLHYRDGAGADSTSMLGLDGVHWNYFLDSDASVMYGSDWRQRQDGRYEAAAVRARYGALDLYAAGFAATGEVPPVTLIRNGDGAATDLPRLGAVTGGQGETITIEQIVAANGARLPSAADAPKEFRAAFVLLTRPGETVTPELLYTLEAFRVRFQQRFAQMTDGRARLRIFTESKNATEPALPVVLAGSGNAATPPGAAAAVAWLEGRQLADGHWQDRAATAMRDTAAALRALEQLAPQSPAIARARAWIASRTVASIDAQAWQYLATGDAAQRDALTAAQAEDGGWGLLQGHPPTPFDTALVGDLVARRADTAAVDSALGRLVPQQNTDGSFGATTGGRGRLLPTLHAARVLNASTLPAHRGAASRAGAWLDTRRIGNGYGQALAASLPDTIELYSLLGEVPLAADGAVGARAFVRDRQQTAGDWSGSVYLTATAALATARDQRVNFALAEPPAATPANPAEGEQVQLAAWAVNTGNIAAPASVARWYDGDPDHGGTRIGDDVAVPVLLAGARQRVVAAWDTTGRAGAHDIHLVLDATQAVQELREDDNRASFAVTVGAAPAQADLQLLDAELSLDPASVAQLPATVHLRGIVRNLGRTAAAGLRLAVHAASAPATIVAEAVLDVPAQGSAPVDITLTVTNPNALAFVLRADPDNAIAEAREDNNAARVSLAFGEAIDFDVAAGDLAVVGAAVAGRDVVLRVDVRNRGTVDSPPATLRVEVVQGASTSTLFDGPVQIAAGATLQRQLTWRAGEAGNAQLRVVVDPAGQVAETREDNNSAQMDFTIVAADRPDLSAVAASLEFTPTPASQGAPVTASLRVRNYGQDVAVPFVVGVYAGDPRLGAVRIGSATVAGLAGSAETTVAVNVPDLDVYGTPTLYAFVDADAAVAELDETNNLAVKPLEVLSLPDVAVSVAGVMLTPALPVAGETVTARVTVRNLGQQDARNVAVRLAEGDATASALIEEKTIAVLAAGGSVDLQWQWTFGRQAGSRAVTVLADPADTVRELSNDNNRATLPVDVQNGNLFTSERYLSPNGDGVRDETAIVFREANGASVRIVNGLGYELRRYDNVASSGDGRGQVIWDGRDRYGRIAADGDYRVVVADAAGKPVGELTVTVDNNRSSVLEAIGTRHALATNYATQFSSLNSALFEAAIPPAASPLQDYLFGKNGVSRGATNLVGLYRAHTLALPQVEPVASMTWAEQNSGSVNYGFHFSASGREVAFVLVTAAGPRPFRAAVGGADQNTPLLAGNVYAEVIGWFGDDAVLLRKTDRSYVAVDVRSGAVQPFRALPGGDGARITTTPDGVLLYNDSIQRDYAFVPRDAGKPVVDIAPSTSANDESYETQVSTDRTRVLVRKAWNGREKVELVNLAAGTRRTLVDRENAAETYPEIFNEGVVLGVDELAFVWIDARNEIVVVDGRTRRLLRFDADGAPLGESALPRVERTGFYRYGITAFSTVASLTKSGSCRPVPDAGGRSSYDPTTASLYLMLEETMVDAQQPVLQRGKGASRNGYEPRYNEGIAQYVRVDLDTGLVETLREGTHSALDLPADAVRYPELSGSCEEDYPPQWPTLILRDGARLVVGERVRSLSRGLVEQPRLGPQVHDRDKLWPDESRALGSQDVVTSVLNGFARIKARSVGDSFELSGVAADRNFAYYELDYALASQPGTWNALTPASRDDIVLDEFITWAPPQAGSYIVRLRVVDRAGNVSTATTAVNARRGADIDGFGVAPRYFSPNGDGVQDSTEVGFRVRQPASLAFVVENGNGAVVYNAEHTYGQGDLGRHVITWDGRDTNGAPVPDGRYRIRFGGFAAWVVVDTVAPTLAAELLDAYRTNDTSAGSGGSVRSHPEVTYSAEDANWPTVSIDAVSAVDGTVEALAEPGTLDRTGSTGVPLALYLSSSYRVTATDPAGNRAVRPLPQGPQRLPLFGYREVRKDTSTPVPFQPLPLDDGAPSVAMEPIRLDEDAMRVYLHTTPAVASLRNVAVQAALLESPSAWFETARMPAAGLSCQALLQCGFDDVSVPLTSQGLERGKTYRVRIVGERDDGSRVVSNHVIVRLGGVALVPCEPGQPIRVIDYNGGRLREAVLHYSLPGNPGVRGEIPASEITDDAAIFNKRPPTGDAYDITVVAVDAAGYRYELESGQCTGTPGGSGLFKFDIDVMPVAQDRCDGEPSGALRVAGELQSGGDTERPRLLRWRHVDGVTLTDVIAGVPIDVPTEGDFTTPRLDIDTHGWPVGTYDVMLDGGYTEGAQTVWRQVARARLPVETTPPDIAIALPAEGARMCAASIGSELVGSVVSPSDVGYRVAIGAGAAPATWRCLHDEGMTVPGVPGQPPVPCTDFANLSELSGTSRVNQPLWAEPDADALKMLASFNGTASLQLKAVNWSGGTVCATRTVTLDSDVDVADRDAPERTWRIDGLDTLAIAPNVANDYATGRIYLRARETVDVTARVVDPQRPDRVFATLLQEHGVTGDIDIVWNGRDDGGAIVPDAHYDIVVEAVDDCGQHKTLRYPAYVKNTPPALAFTSPAPNAVVASAVLNAHGTVVDELLANWTLEVAVAASPDNWQTLAQGTWPMLSNLGVAPLLGSWSRGQLTGPVTLRLRGEDVFGNTAAVTLPVELDAPTKMIAAAAANPLLFSPNGDGVLDAVRVEISLLRAANLSVRVVNGATPVATLVEGPGQAGAQSATWDGRNGAAAWPDGEYAVMVEATDPQGALSPEQALLPVTLDATAPALALVDPSSGFVRPGQDVRFSATDMHFAALDATLSRGGAVIASTRTTTPGVGGLIVPADTPEGALTLTLSARDGAGNRAERVFDLALDRTAPVASFVAPADAAVIAANTATVVTGTVKDSHLASYTLSVAPAGSDAWQTLATGDAEVDAGTLLAWTPNLADGDWRLRLVATDKAGNTSEAIRRVTVDGTPPVAHITAPVDNAYVKPALRVDGTATDTHFAQYRLSVIRASALPNGQWSDVYVGTAPVDAALLANVILPVAGGEHVLRLTVTDRAGLAATDEVRVRIDDQPPPVPTPLSGRVENNRNAILDWLPVAADDLAGYHVYRGGARLTTAPVVPVHYVDTDAPEGSLTYHVVSVDAAGNESAPSNAVTLAIDHTPPRVALTRPGDGERIRGAYEIAGVAHSSSDFNEYRLSLEALAPAGAVRELARSSLPVTQGTLAAWNTLDTPDETRVRVRLEADDRSGNVAAAQVEVVVDNLPPTAPTGLVAAMATSAGAPCAALGGTARDVRTCWNPNTETDLLGYLVYRDGKLVNAPNPPPSDLRPFAVRVAEWLDLKVADGTHTYVVHAIDQAGNISAPSEPAALEPPDSGPPHLTLVSPSPNAAFERSLEIFATSDDRDIARVRFAYRKAGSLGWTDIGVPVTAEPYRVQWTPAGLAYGQYQITAEATDNGGRTDQNPPIVTVRYGDLAAPDAPTSLVARADGGKVALTWTASIAPDVVGYVVSRFQGDHWEDLDSTPLAATAFEQSDLDDGEYRYRVVAVDSSDSDVANRSAPSNVAVANVFSLALTQPVTPTAAVATSIDGRSARAGVLDIHVENASGAADLPPVTLAADGRIALASLALVNGENRFDLRTTDPQGNRSRVASVWVDRGAAPAAPTGVVATVTDHRVDLAWQPNAETDIAGYRVFRRGNAVAADRAVADAITATSERGDSPEATVDGDVQTAWAFDWPFGVEIENPDDPALTLALTSARTVSAVNLTWRTAGEAARNTDLQAWTGHAWLTIARVRNSADTTQSLAPAVPYRTDRLRVIVHGNGIARFETFALAEAQVIERPLVDATQLSETLPDGRYDYRVSAVNRLGFESPRSQPATADVGDAVPPDAVVLTGTVTGRDADLTWTASTAADLASYAVHRGDLTVATIGAGEPRAWRDVALANGTYRYTVVALDAFGNASDPSNAVTLTVAGSGPGIPQALAVTAPAAGAALDLSWSAGAGDAPASYIVRRGAAASGPFVEIGRVSATTYHDAPLANGTTYHYTVEALDAFGNAGGQSAPASGTPRRTNGLATPVFTWPTTAGNPVTTLAGALPLCGYAEPGTTLSVDRDGIAVATATAATAQSSDFEDLLGGPQVAFAPDGLHYAVMRNGAIEVVRRGGAPVTVTPSGDLAYWAPRGLALYYVDLAARAIARVEPGNPVRTFGIAVDDVRAFAISPDETRIAFAGARGAAAEQGLWIAGVDGSNAVRVADVDAQFVADGSLRFAPDGNRVLVATQDEIVVVNVRTARVEHRYPAVTYVQPAWSPDGRFAYASLDADALVVHVVDAGTAAARELARVPELRSLAWSPDGTLVLLHRPDVDGVELRAASDGALVRRADSSGDFAAWTAAGPIAFAWRDQIQWAAQPGYFCTPAVDLVATRHLFSAVARDAAGATSLPAARIEVLRAAASLPDLAIGAADLFFLPADAAPGDRVGALATVRNLGAARAPASVLRAELVEPDGVSRTLVPALPVAALEPGAARSIDLDLGVLAKAGTYRLRVSLDPGNAIVEANETNNQAEARLTLVEAGAPLVEVMPDRALFAPGETVTGSVSVANLGTAARLRVAAVDAAGAVVDAVGDYAVGPLAPGSAWTQRIEWPANGVVAGDYRLRARLTDAAGAVVAERYAPVTIGALRNIELRVEPDTALVTAGGVVRVRSAVAYVEGNVALEGARLRLVAVAPDGTERMLAERALGTMLAGYELHEETLWNTSGAATGTHGLSLRLTAPGLARAAEASVTVEAPGAHVALAGSLALAPADSLVAGQGGDLRYTLSNRGDTVLTGVPVRLRVMPAGSSTAVAQVERTLDLAPGVDVADLLALTAPPLALTTHLAVLEARLPGDADGTWRVLARRSFDVVDGLPPDITVATPPATDVLQPAVVPLRVGIVDAHSAVALAQVRVDAGAWQPLTRGEDGWYARGLAGLADGEHALVVRARDAWGNEATSARRVFKVDATAPVIAITGVSDGDVATQPVTPVITVTDVNPATTEIRLNGDAFVSGTPVTAEGAYVLNVRATDRAGNFSVRTVRFRINSTALALEIVEPADGTETTQSHIVVALQTGPRAVVDLAVGAWHAQLAADDDGKARFVDVPLAMGANVIEARARGTAGNEAGPVRVTVTFQPPTGAGLGGTVQPSQTELPIGAALSVAVRVRNNLGLELSAQQLRVRATAASVLGESAFTRDFAVGETYSTSVDFASGSWGPGPVVITLEHDVLGGGSWTVLDSKTVTVVDRTAPVLDGFTPAAGAVVSAPVVIRVRAVDALSGIDTVEAAVDDGEWFALAPATGVPDGYQATAPALADGEHRYTVRARDTAGNVATAAPVAFAIDTLPPTITIGGVPTEDAVQGPVQPVISVNDAHPGEVTYQLNASPYPPNAPIYASGDYTLFVFATDRAGNRSEARAHFVIDNDVPTVTITAPGDGATVETPTVKLEGRTEASSKVEVTAGSFGATVFADTGGAFAVEGVPLSEGANTITVRATDRVGNAGPVKTVHVTYQPSSSATLGGVMTPPLLMATGSPPWPVGYLLHNQSFSAAVNQPMRVVVRRGGSDIATYPFDVSIAPLGLYAGDVKVAFGSFAPGTYGAYLEAYQSRPGNAPAWAVLDMDLTTVYRPCGRGPLDPDGAVFADDFNTGDAPRDDDSVFCNSFEDDPEADAASHAPSPWLSFREAYAYASRPLPSGAL